MRTMIIMAVWMPLAAFGQNFGNHAGPVVGNDGITNAHSSDENINNLATSGAEANGLGLGVGLGLGQGGDASVDGSGNSRNTNRNALDNDVNNANVGINGQSSTNRNSNRNVANGGDATGGNASSNANGGTAGAIAGAGAFSEGSDASAVTGDSVSRARSSQGQAQGQTADNAVNITDSSVSTSTWTQPPAAFAGFSQNVIQNCSRIIGFDFRGADLDSAGGASFGLPLSDRDCELDRATAQAFSLGNYEMGWRLFCSQTAVWKGYRLSYRAEFGSKPTKLEAINGCIDTGRTVLERFTETVVEPADLSEYATRDMVNETVERAFTQSLVK